MKIKFKKLNEKAVLPKYAHSTDGGMDLTAISDANWSPVGYVEYDTGLAIEIPEGYVGLIFPRSSISKYDLNLTNSVGVIDSSYRGEIKFRFNTLDRTNKDFILYKKGDRIGQLVILPRPQIEPEWSEELSDTKRGTGGYGSSGK